LNPDGPIRAPASISPTKWGMDNFLRNMLENSIINNIKLKIRIGFSRGNEKCVIARIFIQSDFEYHTRVEPKKFLNLLQGIN
jgi:hypothetical protein